MHHESFSPDRRGLQAGPYFSADAHLARNARLIESPSSTASASLNFQPLPPISHPRAPLVAHRLSSGLQPYASSDQYATSAALFSALDLAISVRPDENHAPSDNGTGSFGTTAIASSPLPWSADSPSVVADFMSSAGLGVDSNGGGGGDGAHMGAASAASVLPDTLASLMTLPGIACMLGVCLASLRVCARSEQ